MYIWDIYLFQLQNLDYSRDVELLQSSNQFLFIFSIWIQCNTCIENCIFYWMEDRSRKSDSSFSSWYLNKLTFKNRLWSFRFKSNFFKQYGIKGNINIFRLSNNLIGMNGETNLKHLEHAPVMPDKITWLCNDIIKFFVLKSNTRTAFRS